MLMWAKKKKKKKKQEKERNLQTYGMIMHNMVVFCGVGGKWQGDKLFPRNIFRLTC